MNELIIRLTNTDTIQGNTFVGASYIPESPSIEEELRKALGIDTDSSVEYIVFLCSLVKSYSWLYSLVGEKLNTWEQSVNSATVVLDFNHLYNTLAKQSSGWAGVLTYTGLYKSFFLAPSAEEGVAVAIAALASYNDDIRFVQ